MKMRQLRVAATIREDLAAILPTVLQWDKSLNGQRMTIVNVTVSTDLKRANISMSLDSTEEKVILLKLNELVPQIKKKLSSLMTGRFVPDLKFFCDTSLAREVESRLLFQKIAADVNRDDI